METICSSSWESGCMGWLRGAGVLRIKEFKMFEGFEGFEMFQGFQVFQGYRCFKGFPMVNTLRSVAMFEGLKGLKCFKGFKCFKVTGVSRLHNYSVMRGVASSYLLAMTTTKEQACSLFKI